MNSLVAIPLVATPVPAPLLAGAPPAATELLDLERAFFRQVNVYLEAMEKTSAALDRLDAQMPARSDALRADYKRDFSCFDGLAGRWRNRIEDNGGYWPHDAIENHIRNWPCEKVWTKTKNMDGTDLGDRDLTDEDVSGVDFLEVEERTPDLEARARVDEIVIAYDRHQAERARLRESTGLQSAEVMETWLLIGLQDMSCRLMKIPATSLADFQAKAKVAAFWHEGEIDVDNFDDHGDQCLAWIVRELGQKIEVA